MPPLYLARHCNTQVALHVPASGSLLRTVLPPVAGNHREGRNFAACRGCLSLMLLQQALRLDEGVWSSPKL